MSAIHDFLNEFRHTRDFSQLMPRLSADINFRRELFAEIAATDYPYPEYASWIALHYFKKHPQDWKQWVPLFRKTLLETTNHTVQRNIASALISCTEDMSDDVELLDQLFHFLGSNQSLPALKVNAFRVIEAQYLKKHPELLRELHGLILLHKEDSRPSVASIVRYFHKRYRKHPFYDQQL